MEVGIWDGGRDVIVELGDTVGVGGRIVGVVLGGKGDTNVVDCVAGSVGVILEQPASINPVRMQ